MSRSAKLKSSVEDKEQGKTVLAALKRDSLLGRTAVVTEGPGVGRG